MQNVLKNILVWLIEKAKVFEDVWIIGETQRNKRVTEPTGIRE